jgi:hypothetical protein
MFALIRGIGEDQQEIIYHRSILLLNKECTKIFLMEEWGIENEVFKCAFQINVVE